MGVRRRRGITRGVPLDDDHLAAGLPQLEGLPLQDDEGLVGHHQNPELAVVDGDGERAFILLGAYFGGHDVSIKYLATVSLPDGQCLFISR